MFLLNKSVVLIIIVTMLGCQRTQNERSEKSAAQILGNPAYLAISYGGYRENSRNVQPTLKELKEDMKILSAMGIKLLRTYNLQYSHASNVLKAIKELKAEQPEFEMYVMLGAWIDCQGAWTDQPNHEMEDYENNRSEINKAVILANEYPDIVKIIAVGNEAMVKWASSYYVQPAVILKWVNYLQNLKNKGALSKEVWITSSDNFASWGGGGTEYHVEDLNNLIKAVDFISMHTYPMHDTHYNPVFWNLSEEERQGTLVEQTESLMLKAKNYATSQYESVVNYMKGLGVNKPVHIGETGWASVSSGHYGPNGSKATDEYKQALFYNHMRNWTNASGITCFYFEAFNESWKDALNPKGSENHFGLFTIDGQAKYALWDLVDSGVFEGLMRNGKPIEKTYGGNRDKLLGVVEVPSPKHGVLQKDKN